MPEPIAVFKDVSYQYPGSTGFALMNVNLEVRRGELLGLIGPTGAGKTTLCLAFNGIVPQFFGGRFFGTVTVSGKDTLDHPISVMANRIGMVFEDPETQLITTSVENEIAFALENLKVPREDMLDRISYALSAVRLQGYEKKHPHELSGGEKQRLAIAAAIAVKPGLLIFDEPTSQLDSAGAEKVFATARELNQELGITIVMVSHAAEEMAAFADRIAVLSGGQIVALGEPDEIYADVDFLERHSLRPPQIAATFYDLGRHGFAVPKVPVQMADVPPLLPDLSKNLNGNHLALSSPPETGAAPILSVKDLSYDYPDGTRALHGVSLDISDGEYVLIAGQNGAGKTTLVKHFLNLLQPARGSVYFNGESVEGLSVSDLARRIGYVSQNPSRQIFCSTVKDEIGFALKNLGYDPKEVEIRTALSLAAMDLEDVQDNHPLSLPKGALARVVIGAILAMEPEVIIFDEPTTGQDYQGARQILDISRDLHESGRTIIVITHHLYLMPEYANRVVVMGKGTILLDQDIRTAFYATDKLNSTYLFAPQAVLLSQELQKYHRGFPSLLTPTEIVDYFSSGRNPS
jgi:energy-coupling factor transporter ATP-binding protein EcfA2